MAYKYLVSKLPSDIANIIVEYSCDYTLLNDYITLLRLIINSNIFMYYCIKKDCVCLTFKQFKAYVDNVYKYENLQNFDYINGYKKHVDLKRQPLYNYRRDCNKSHYRYILLRYFEKYYERNNKEMKYMKYNDYCIIERADKIDFNFFKTITDSILNKSLVS